jgi:uncharacterized membrane protein YjjB (DUF3815 family)
MLGVFVKLCQLALSKIYLQSVNQQLLMLFLYQLINVYLRKLLWGAMLGAQGLTVKFHSGEQEVSKTKA